MSNKQQLLENFKKKDSIVQKNNERKILKTFKQVENKQEIQPSSQSFAKNTKNKKQSNYVDRYDQSNDVLNKPTQEEKLLIKNHLNLENDQLQVHIYNKQYQLNQSQKFFMISTLHKKNKNRIRLNSNTQFQLQLMRKQKISLDHIHKDSQIKDNNNMINYVSNSIDRITEKIISTRNSIQNNNQVYIRCNTLGDLVDQADRTVKQNINKFISKDKTSKDNTISKDTVLFSNQGQQNTQQNFKQYKQKQQLELKMRNDLFINDLINKEEALRIIKNKSIKRFFGK